ncbi:MAG: tetratricopeptide repeat protein [Sphingomonadaceae bacterium]
MATTPPARPSATRPADPRDEAFLREVDEEYRRDEFNRFARRYGRWILLAVGVGLAALGGWLFWQAEQNKQNESLSEQFTLALNKVDAGDTEAARAALDLTAKGDNAGYTALARLTDAGLAAAAGEDEKGAGLLRAVTDDAAAPQALRDVARLKRIRLTFDSMEPATVIQELAPYLAGDNPWYPIAAEMTALAHMKAGENDKAGPIFLRLAGDGRAPPSLRARAEQMAATLGQDVAALTEARIATAQAAANDLAPEAAPAETN